MATRSAFKLQSRSFAAVSLNSAQNPFKVFDRQVKRSQKDRAAARDGGNRSRTVDYVRNEVADRMIERFLASLHYEELV
jgi:NADH dehydrogenase [ubiquinone] 1 alpha subcomplex assembly factor 5